MLHAQTLRHAHLKHVFTMVLSHLNAAACAHMQAVDAIMHKAGICMSGKPARKCHSVTHYWKFHSRSTFDQPLVKPPASLVVPGSASRKEGFNVPPLPHKALIPVFATCQLGDLFIHILHLQFVQSDPGRTSQATTMWGFVLRRWLAWQDFAFSSFQMFSLFLENTYFPLRPL